MGLDLQESSLVSSKFITITPSDLLVNDHHQRFLILLNFNPDRNPLICDLTI
jgi:hypothetical protein